MSHKLTKEVKKRLAEYGAKIGTPGYVPGVPTPISAAELRERGTTHDRAGKPVQDSQTYYLAPAAAVNHTRRLQQAYQRGGWPAVEVYLHPFRTPEYAAKQALAKLAAAAPGAAEVAPAAEAAPTAGLDETAPPVAGPSLVAEFFSAGLEGPISPEAERLLAQSAAAVEAQIGHWCPVPAEQVGLLSESAGTFEPLPLTSADEVQTELRTCEPVKNVDVQIDNFLPAPILVATDKPRPLAEQHQAAAGEFQQLVAEHRAAGTLPAAPALLYARPYDEGTDELLAAEQRLIDQLYEAGHPGPMECPIAQQCAGSCGACLN